MKHIRPIAAGLSAVMAFSLLAACSPAAPAPKGSEKPPQSSQALTATVFTDQTTIEGVQIEDEATALAGGAPALSLDLLGDMAPSAPGIKSKDNGKAVIDYSNVGDGYVMAKYHSLTDKRLKCQVFGPSGVTYTYNMTPGEWETFPLSDGSGTYKIVVYDQISGDRYATVLTLETGVSLNNEFAPFLRPNQYVDYTYAPNTVLKGQQLIGGETDVLKKVEKVYDFVIHNITYDNQLAMTVKSGYLPVLDNVLTTGKGICFDYAALMAAMLRSQGVPTKLVVGFAGSAYHAWISVWSEETGWVENAVFFDGDTWQRMDPTFASTGNSAPEIMQYIGDGSNYQAKYMY